MKRIHQIVFVISLLALSWFAMMAIHEFGHVIGGWVTGGHIERVVLHPLTISRTDVDPNPYPLIVVWLGPILGGSIPVLVWSFIPKRFAIAKNVAKFFAGFCLIANGVYIAGGAIDRVGDCGVMLQLGSPFWLLILFGAITIPLGLFAWHRLGSVKAFFKDPSLVDPVTAYSFLAALIILLALEFAFSSM